jgi:very-long-chain (3R)-3-hydroxyacyl-CoA dehydratase
MGFLSKSYLVLYNSMQVAGWAYLLALTLPHLRSSLIDGKKDSGQLYRDVGPALRLFQTAAVLEVLHAIVGLVRSSAAITAFQVASRVFLIFSLQ